MLVIKIELHSAITGRVTEIGRMNIANDGNGTHSIGHYKAQVLRRGNTTPGWETNEKRITRRGAVDNYPRQAYNVWRLVLRALKSAFPEEA
jgi:hypothetical protein